MWLSLCCGCQSAVRTTSVIGDQRPRRQCRIAAAVGLAVLLACSLASRPTQAQASSSSRSSAPRGPPWLPRNTARHARHAASKVPARQPARQPWQNPCGTSVAVAPMTTPTRNPRPHRPIKNAHDFDWPSPSMEGGALGGGLKGWSLRTVRSGIRVARAHLRHRRRNINQVYGQVKMIRDQYSYDWLPQQQVPWYRAEVTCLDRDSQAAQVLPALRSALQNFSATFMELQKARNPADKPGLGNRTLIMHELASHVKGMLCEVETTMQERGLPLPPAGLPADGLAGVDASRWDPEPDLTRALIQDWGVVSAYTDALYGWALILRELGHAPKVRRGEGQAGPGPGGRGCPSEPHRLHGGHGGGRQRNQLRRKQRGHPGGEVQGAHGVQGRGQGKGRARGAARGGADKQEARRKRRRRRRKQRERQRMRRRLMEEMARQNGGRPWRPAKWHDQPHSGPRNFS
ncbi:uncharacterized protein LOC113204310 [Frankliniella occidentalis]|uniref:Uncharacterized protein LOC113204310 n=1 Tax=Frankliniella occidentalis TaxID=133901 RepID=A0A9C6TYR8_FRAOC|nr:uncharacterized protein LOC113204310 [Frankliniella occidentalis]